MPASATQSWIFSSPSLMEKLRPALQCFRRTQLRGGSFYSSSRTLIPLLALAIAWVRLAKWRSFSDLHIMLNQTESLRHVLATLGVFVLWNFSLTFLQHEGSSGYRQIRDEIFRLLAASATCGVLISFAATIRRSLEHGFVLGFLVVFGLALLSISNVGAFVFASAISRRLTGKRMAIVVGTGRRAALCRKKLLTHSSDVEIFGCVDDEFYGNERMRSSYLGSISRLPELLKSQPVELVLIALPMRSKYDEIQQVIEICETIGVESHYMHDFFETERVRVHLHAQAPQDFSVLTVSRSQAMQLLKRMLDVVGASLLLLLFSPVMVAVAIAIRCTSAGPVFFRQLRYGRHRKLFRMLKFRSMVQDAEVRQAELEARNEATGAVFKLKQDPRVTRVGSFLRKTSLDELPQLFNVLTGQMSLVGPRPLPLRDVSRFEEPWLLRRFSVRPGLTCTWQVSGRSNTTFDDWMRQDLEYIDNWSLALDVSLLFRTVPAVLRGDGAV